MLHWEGKRMREKVRDKGKQNEKCLNIFVPSFSLILYALI